MIEQQQQIDNDEISLKELIELIKKELIFLKTKWSLILIFTLIGSAFGLIYFTTQKTTYTATMSFVMEDDKSGGLGAASSIGASLGIDIGGSGGGLFASSNIIELMKSRLVIEKTLLNQVPFYKENSIKISLADYYLIINNKNNYDKKKGSLNYKNLIFSKSTDRNNFSNSQNATLEQVFNSIIKNNLKITQKDKKSNFNAIEVTSEDELFSKYFCEQLAKEISDFYIETKTKKARSNFEILQLQTDSIRTELNSAITSVAIAGDNIYNLNPALNVKKTTATKRQIDVQSNAAILNQLVAQLELAKVNLRKETPLIQVVDSPILPLKNNKTSLELALFFGTSIALFVITILLILVRISQKILQ